MPSERQQVMAVEIDEAFQRLAALQATEDLAERGRRPAGSSGIEDGPHLGVGGDAVDPIDRAEVVVGVAAAVVEGQQGGVFEREHREGRHQGIAQGDFDVAGPRVRKGAELGAEQLKEGVGGEILPYFTGGECHGGATPSARVVRLGGSGGHDARWDLRNGRSKQAAFFKGKTARPGIAGAQPERQRRQRLLQSQDVGPRFQERSFPLPGPATRGGVEVRRRVAQRRVGDGR